MTAERWENPGQRCQFNPSCDHQVSFKQDGWLLCACHLDPEGIPPDLLTEAIRLAALEDDDFEVDGNGNIRLKEGK